MPVTMSAKAKSPKAEVLSIHFSILGGPNSLHSLQQNLKEQLVGFLTTLHHGIIFLYFSFFFSGSVTMLGCLPL